MVARQTLTLFVRVQILLPQPVESLDTQRVRGFSFSKALMPASERLLFSPRLHMKTPFASEFLG